MSQEKVQVVLRHTLRGHTDRVTAIETPTDSSEWMVTSSDDKSVIVWSLAKDNYGAVVKELRGHSGSVRDVALSHCNKFAVTASSDKTLLLWDLYEDEEEEYPQPCPRFVGHTDDVLSVAFSPDNRQILSASCDGTIKLWNIEGECTNTIQTHTNCVSCGQFSLPASCSWDRIMKYLRNLQCESCERSDMLDGFVKNMAISPDRTISAIRAAIDDSVHIFDLYSMTVVKLRVSEEGDDVDDDVYCTSLNWSADGSTLFGGHSDGSVRVWEVARPQESIDEEEEVMGFSDWNNEEVEEWELEKKVLGTGRIEREMMCGKKPRNKDRTFWSTI